MHVHTPRLPWCSLGVALLLLLGNPPLRAQEPTESRIGAELRIRNENWNNLFDYNDGADDQRNQIRYRSRVWAQLELTPAIEFNVGLNSETYSAIEEISSSIEEIGAMTRHNRDWALESARLRPRRRKPVGW